MRRIAAQLEISAIQVGQLLRQLRGHSERAPLDLQALDAAARLLMDVALRIDTLVGQTPRNRAGAATASRDEVNYLAALALALVRAGDIDQEQLLEQLRDLADHESGVLVEAAARLSHEHDTSELAAAQAIYLLERAASPGLSV